MVETTTSMRSEILELQRQIIKSMPKHTISVESIIAAIHDTNAEIVVEKKERKNESKASRIKARPRQFTESFQRCPSCGGLISVVLRKHN